MTAGRCPRCGEERLIEYDVVLGRWFCAVCATSWGKGKG